MHLAEQGPRGLRASLEEGLARVLRLRFARLSVGRALATGVTVATFKERGVIEVPVASGLAVLEIGTGHDRALDEWGWQVLGVAAQLAAIVIELETTRPAPLPAPGRRAAGCGLVGASEPMRLLRERIQRVARREVPVLIEGESGVGKELVARQIHELSARARGPFVAVNCAALVESLLEAELFGIEDRTATGVRGRRGKFELAEGGTLFLDEIGDLSPPAQAKLLRVVQDHAVERVGGHGTQRVDVRLVAATNRGLLAMVSEGRFREDLYYRLNGVDIQVPPLRVRRDDIPSLIDHFLGAISEAPRAAMAPEATDALMTYHWPGNVRELARAIERAVTLADGAEITLEHLPPAVAAHHKEFLLPSLEEGASLRLLQSRYARITLQRCGNNKRQACRVLGITYHTLQAHLRFIERYEREGTVRARPA